MTARDPYGALGLEDDPELAFAGSRALRQMAESCESYQVGRLRQVGHTWAEIAGWAGVSAQAVHKKARSRLASRGRGVAGAGGGRRDERSLMS